MGKPHLLATPMVSAVVASVPALRNIVSADEVNATRTSNSA